MHRESRAKTAAPGLGKGGDGRRSVPRRQRGRRGHLLRVPGRERRWSRSRSSLGPPAPRPPPYRLVDAISAVLQQRRKQRGRAAAAVKSRERRAGPPSAPTGAAKGREHARAVPPWCRCTAGLCGCGKRAGSQRSSAQSLPCRPRGVSPVQLLLCTLQQYREFPQVTSVSKTTPICTELHGAQHVLGSGTKQRPTPGKKSSFFLPSPATAVVVWRWADRMTRRTWRFCGQQAQVSGWLGLEALGKRAVLSRSGCPQLTRSPLVGVGFPREAAHLHGVISSPSVSPPRIHLGRARPKPFSTGLVSWISLLKTLSVYKISL